MATLDQLQAEVERRLDEIRDAEVDDEDDEDAFDEDAHSFKRGPFPQPVVSSQNPIHYLLYNLNIYFKIFFTHTHVSVEL